MTAFRLQTFSPRPEPAPAPKPEPKLPVLTQDDVAQARAEGYRDGFLDAQSEVTAAFLDDASRLTSDLVEALNDARLTNEAARRHVMAGLAPTFMALCRAITPALAAAGFAAEIAARLERALLAAPDATPRLRCAPEMAPTLAALFVERGLTCVVEAAPEIMPREAELCWDEGFDRIDLDACVAEISACLGNHLTPAAARPEQGEHDRG